jgi:hypothetical protein
MTYLNNILKESKLSKPNKTPFTTGALPITAGKHHL